MKYLIILSGLSGSGKDTWIKENRLEPYTLSSDDYRLKVTSFIPNLKGHLYINQQYNKLAWKRLYEDLEFRMKHGELTFVNATHLTRDSIKPYKKLCDKYNYRMILVIFDTDLDTCLERDKYRAEYSVGEEVLKHQDEMREKFSNSIKQFKPNEVMHFLLSRYTPLDLSNYKKIHVIGDIHGCFEPLKEFWQKNINENEDAVIFVGDYFDRGIQNDEVFNFLYERLDNDNIFMLEGNHDRKLRDYVNGEEVRGFTTTLEQFKKAGITDKMIKKFYKSLAPYALIVFNWQTYIITHAGIPTPRVCSVYTSDDVFVKGIGEYEDMEGICENFDKYSYDGIQIFGHRNNEDLPIKINKHCYNLCGFPEYGGKLKAVSISVDGMQEHYIENNLFSTEEFYAAMERYPDRFQILNVDMLIEAMMHNKYVKETVYGDISSFQFTKDAFYEGHWSQVTCKARGLFINTKTGKIVARSYDKFFLLNQYEYCTLDKFNQGFTVAKKYDGFLGIIGYDEESDRLLFCSKSTLAPEGDYARLFESKVRPKIKNEWKLKQFLREFNCSLVFECIAPEEDEHIIKYDKDQVVLLDVVANKIDFLRYSYSWVLGTVERHFDGVMAKELLYTNFILDDASMNRLKSQEGEGYVFTDTNGKMFKLKTYSYEAAKICRGLEEYYTKLAEEINHTVACPSIKKIEGHYGVNFHKKVVERLKIDVPKIIEKINEKVLDKQNSLC